MTASRPEPFTIAVPEADLDDLKQRLARTILAESQPEDGWRYGIPSDELRRFVDYWRDEYDWRAQEAAMNALANFKITIDDVPVHFIHERGKGPNPIPIILNHGWPWTFWDFREVIGPLTDPAAYGGDPADSFDVIVPSTPGNGFSVPLDKPVSFWMIADLWVQLMDALGYERFATHGGDLGALISTQLGHKYPERIIGLHTMHPLPPNIFNVERPWYDSFAFYRVLLGADDKPELARALFEFEQKYVAHMAVHNIDPQTLSHALHDSPAGMAAWLLERRYTWGDCPDGLEKAHGGIDALLTHVMLFWITRAFASSVRTAYIHSRFYPWEPSHPRLPMVEPPMGLTTFLPDRWPGAENMNEIIAPLFNIVATFEHDRGGHFGAGENPEAVVHDIRATFRRLRQRGDR